MAAGKMAYDVMQACGVRTAERLRQLAEHYARAGWRLALIVRKEAETKAWLSASGASANSYQIHLADVADIEGMLAVGKAIVAKVEAEAAAE